MDAVDKTTRILFSNSTTVPHVATGIEFGASDGTGSRFTAFANKEVIVAAGAIQVRQIVLRQLKDAQGRLLRRPRCCNCLVLEILPCSANLESIPSLTSKPSDETCKNRCVDRRRRQLIILILLIRR